MWLIGDVHGCADELNDLISAIHSSDKSPNMLCLGDLIDRGPHLVEVFDLLYEYKIQSVLGNHEMNFFREAIGVQPCRSNARKETLDRFNILSEHQKELILSYIEHMDAWLYNGKNFLSHAIPTTYGLLNKHTCASSNFCTKSDLNYLDHSAYDKYDKFYHGHMHWSYLDIHKQIANNSKFINLDSGCVYGGHLTALNIATNEVIQVKARKTYYQHK